MPDAVLITLAAVVVVLILLFMVIAMRPATFQVARSTTISAPPSAVFETVNDFHNWEAWSPWAKIDPTMKSTYEGSPAGLGAIYTWNGNKKVGAGRMTILESKPGEFVRLQLQFLRPFAATNNVEFALKPEANQTAMTWTMTGKNNFLFKAFSLVMSMDKMVGKDFEKGLAQLKALVESSQKPAATGS